MENIRLIPESYRRANTFTHNVHKRGEHAFIYKVVCDPSFGSKKTSPIYYEVFKRMINKGGIARFGGGPAIEVSPMERKPGDNSFGTWAWAVMSIDDATKIFNNLEMAKGDLKTFWALTHPAPVVKTFEFHNETGVPFVFKIGGKTIIKTVDIKIDPDMNKMKATAMHIFAAGFSPDSGVNIDSYTPVLVESEDEELANEDENSNEE